MNPKPAAAPESSFGHSWHWFRHKSWRWQVAQKYMAENFLRRLETPALLLEPPATLIDRDPPRTATIVARLALSESGFPALFIKRYLPVPFCHGLKDLFRSSRSCRAFRLAGLLHQLNIPTAQPLAAGELRRWRWLKDSYLITEEVPDVFSWLEYDARQPDGPHRIAIIRAFARLLAKLHDAGLSHADPARPNFLIRLVGPRPVDLILIDLDGLRRHGRVSDHQARKDLRHAMRRIPASNRERLWFLAQYCRSRRLSAHDLARKVRREILTFCSAHGLKETYEFGTSSSGGLQWQVRWPMVTPRVESILRAPDQFLEQATVLKPSRSSAVGAEGGIVLKRYNYRKWASRFKDWFRPSRGRRCFLKAYLLEIAGVPTAGPIAAADRRCWGLVVRSYFVMAEIPGAISLRSWNGNKRAACQQVAELLGRLHQEGFTHRDLKDGNILFDAAGQPRLIDLDGLRFVRETTRQQAIADLARLARGMTGWHHRLSRSDRARFLAAYCRARGLPDWRCWWKEIERRCR